MRKILFSLICISALAMAKDYQPNAVNFTCPDDQKVDLSQTIQISAGERPSSVGECYWREPRTSFSVSDDGLSVTGHTSWTLAGAYSAADCTQAKGEVITSVGVINKVTCKRQIKYN